MNAKPFKITLLVSIIALQFSCMGDRKTVIGQELGDDSFINKNFKANLIDYQEGMNACKGLNASDLASLYKVTSDLVIIDDPLTNTQRRATATPMCSFYIKSGESDFLWLRGSIAVNREVAKDEYMGDVAEATGGGENWQEAWELKKSMYQSSEWISGMGKAAIWNDKNKTLEIKFDGYTLVVNPLKNVLNEDEKALNRDYKKMAVGMAKLAGYIN